MLSRRDLVGKLAAGAAGVVVLGVAGKQQAKAAVQSNAPQTQGHGEEWIAEQGAAAVEPGPAIFEPKAEAASAAPEPVLPPPPWELIAPLAAGSVVAHDWHVADLSSPMDGACVLTLRNERGRVQRVHLCRNAGKPQGLVYTKQVDLVVMNGGQSDLATEEHLAQAVAGVAHVIAGNEQKNTEAIVALLPHADRLRQFSGTWTLR